MTNLTSERFILQWHITDRCNRSCLHCYQEPVPSPELALSQLKTVIDQFKELLTVRAEQNGGVFRRGHINLTGGEPLYRQDWQALLETLHENSTYFSFALLSNGSMIDSATAHGLKKLGAEFIQLSLEGPEKIHDHIRGKGAYGETIRAIKTLADVRIKTYLSFTAHRDNYRQFPSVAALARLYRVAKLWADRFIPFGRGKEMGDKTLSPSQTVEFIKLMAQEGRKTLLNRFSGTEITLNRSLQFFGTRRKPYHCSAAVTLLAVMPDGTLYPCRRLPLPVGNLLKTPLAVLYEKSDLLREIRQAGISPKGCEQCRCLVYCQGGSRCLAFALTGDWQAGDPGCILNTAHGSR